MSIIYGPEPAIAYQRGIGIVISPGNRPELFIHSEDGVLTRRVRLTLEPQPVTTSEKRRVIDHLDRRIAEAPEPLVAMLRSERDGLVFAETKPAWTSIQLDDRGYFWLTIKETAEERTAAGGIAHRVLAPDGRYLGDTRWPTTRFSSRLSRGHLLVIEADETTDEPLLTVYRIEPAAARLRYP